MMNLKSMLADASLFEGRQIDLFQKEFQILVLMAQHPNQVWTAEQLYDHIGATMLRGQHKPLKCI